MITIKRFRDQNIWWQ